MTRTARTLAALAAVALLATSLPAADRTSALIGAQLDKLVKLQLDNTPLPQVLATIERETGVPVRVSDDVYATLPWGEQTPITASVEGLSLRDALTAISGKLGLRFDLRDEFVELSPVPSLRRMGRRATLQELRTLDLLGTTKLPPSPSGWTIDSLGRAIDQRFVDIDRQRASTKAAPASLVLELRPAQGVDLAKSPVLVPRDASIADALDALASQSKLTWYPWGDSVVVLPKRDVVAARLDRPVSMRYDGVDIATVLIDLSRQAGFEIAVEPGAIQRVPPEFRIIRIGVEGVAPARKALETLQGFTGLGYVVTDDAVYVWNQNSNPASGQRGRVVATMTTPSGATVLIYEDQLSPEARETLRGQQQRAAQRLEAELKRLSPSTLPAATHDN